MSSAVSRESHSSVSHKKASMNDVAAAAHVSKTTISRYLHGEYGYMSHETRKRIAAVIEELEYRPNKMAQGLKAFTTNMIGVTIANIGNPFSSQLLKGIQAVCREEGFQLLVSDVDDRSELERQSIESLLDAQVDGVIVNTVGNNDAYLAQYCATADAKPIVLLDRTTADVICDSVVTDNHDAVDQMMTHLAESGFTQVVFVTGTVAGVSTRTSRVDAFQSWCRTHHMIGSVVTLSSWHIDEQHPSEVERAIAQLQASHGVGTVCIFANNEETARYILSTMPAVQDGKYGLCTFGEEQWARFSGRGITCLDQDPQLMGRIAAQTLVKRINERNIRQGATSDIGRRSNVNSSAESASGSAGASDEVLEPFAVEYVPATLHVHNSTILTI